MHGIQFIQDLAVILVVAGVVGWICQRLGLSVVVGFLAAGMVVGPYTPPFTLVSDVNRIETLAQVGLGRWRAADLAAALAAADRSRCGPVAPPDGLYLERVDYPPK